MLDLRSLRRSIFLTALFCAPAAAQSVLISPSPIDFGNQQVNTTSNAWTLTVNNTGSIPVQLGAIGLADAVNFIQANNCPTTLSGYQNCNVTVAFSPKTSGPITGQLLVPSNALTSAQGVMLTGSGTGSGGASAPSPQFAPSSIQFAVQNLYTSSNAWTATLNNSGAGALNIASLTLGDPADFSFSSNCGASVSGYSSCNVLVVFTPTTVGPVTGTLTLLSNGSPQTMTLSGVGTAPAAVVTVAPQAVDFGSQNVGQASSAQTITVSNGASNAIALNPMQLAAGSSFSIASTTCGSTLAANTTCNVTVVYTPTAAGATAASLTFLANNQPESVSLTGSGTTSPATVSFSPGAVDFGSIHVGQSASSWTVSINNTSAVDAVFSQVPSLSGSSAFSFTASCLATLPAHQSCNLVVSFLPSAGGPFNGQINLTVLGQLPQALSLAGTGVQSASVLQLSPSAADFGSVTTGQTANAWTFNVSNPTGSPVAFASPITLAGSPEFLLSTTCSSSLPAYSQCHVLVSFFPVVPGQVHGQIVVNDANGTTQTATIIGTGVGPALTPTVTLAPGMYDFGSVVVNTPIPDAVFTVTNGGATDAYFSANASLTGSSLFAISANSCANPITAGTSCTIKVSFKATASGTSIGELTLPFAGMASPLIGGLNGTATQATLTVSASSLDLGTSIIGQPSGNKAFTIANPSNVDLAFQFTAVPRPFTANSTCGNIVLSGASCLVMVNFTPTASGPVGGPLVVTQGGSSSSWTINLIGTGIHGPAQITLNQASLTFPTTTVGKTAASQTITVTNTSAWSVAINLGNLTSQHGEFTDTTTCGTSLAALGSCQVVVTFAPTAVGADSGSVTLADTDDNRNYIVTMSGTGEAVQVAGLVASPTSINFGDPNYSSLGGSTVMITNPTSNRTYFNVRLADPDFIYGVGCSTDWDQRDALVGYFALDPGQSCQMWVNYLGSINGNHPATIVITPSNGQPISVSLIASSLLPADDDGFTASASAVVFPDSQLFRPTAGQSVTFTNTSHQPKPFNYFLFEPDEDLQFTETGRDCSYGQTMAPGQSCTISFNFNPYLRGPQDAYLVDWQNGSTARIHLTGTGVTALSGIPSTYVINVDTGELDLSDGHSGTAKFAVTPISGFIGTISLTCGKLPPGATCAFSPATLTADGSGKVLTANVTVRYNKPAGSAIFWLPAVLLLAGMAGLRKRLKLAANPLLAMLVVGAILAGITGCAQSGFFGLIPSQLSQVTVSATSDAASGGQARNAGLIVRIKQ